MEMPSLGDQELELLQFITEHSPMTVREAYEGYGKDKGLARTTILTTVSYTHLDVYKRQHQYST